jgi:hypothetical protein
MNQLRDKMVLQIVQKLKKKYPQIIVDPRSIDLVKHELDMMMERGPIEASDLNRMAATLKASCEANMNTTHHKKANASMRLNADQTQEDHAAFAGTYPGSKAQDHDTMSKVGSFKDVSKLAQEVRSLPPLVQRRMVVKTLQDPWSKKIQEEQKEHERMLEMQKQRKQQMKAEQKQYLDAQVARREEQKNLEKERMKLLAAEEAHQRAIWKEEAELSARRRKEDVNHLMQDLVHQRQNALMKKQHDLEEKKRDEAEKVRRLQQEIRIEEQEKLHKREKVKEEINSFIAFNRGMKEAHDAEKKKAQEMDVIMLREYEAKLEQQERERQAHLKKISERQARQYAMADRVHQSLQELASADEEKAKREQEALERRQMDEETRRKEKKKEEQRKVKEVVARQIEEKEEAKRKAQEEAARLKEEVARSVKAAEEKEQQRKMQAKQFALQGLREIDKQLVTQHEQRFKPAQIKVGEVPPPGRV